MTSATAARRCACATGFLILAIGPAPGGRVLGQQRGVTVIETEAIRVPTTVSDRRGRFIQGLKQQDFQVFDDGVPQELTSFAIEESGIAAELLIDVSGSMSYRLEEAKRAAMQFVQQMGPKDVVKVLQFDEKVTPLSGFSSDKALLLGAIGKAQPGGVVASPILGAHVGAMAA